MLALSTAVFGCDEAVPTPTATATITLTPSKTPELGVAFVTLAVPTSIVRQVTPTPLPSSTPTATPTPIIYQIAAGDTLLAIAIRNGNTVEEIEALNPGIQPNLLQIGQPIILPPRQDNGLEGIAPTAIPLSVAVLSVELYQTPLGGAWLMGDVVNNGQLAAENLQVAITLRDESNRPVATAAAWVYPTLLLPGERGGFALLLEQLPERINVPEASIVAGNSVAQLGNRYLDLDVIEIVADFGDAESSLSGQIANQGNMTATTIRLLFILYDSQQRMTGLVQWQSDVALPAGSSIPFTVLLAPPGGAPADYYVNIEALLLLEE